MTGWVDASVKKPKQGQWVVIIWNGVFKTGKFDRLHPFGPAVVDRESGRYFTDFTYWKSLNYPKALSL